MEPRTALRHYILTTCLPGRPEAALSDDAELRETGVVDSMRELTLIDFVEHEFGVVVEREDVELGRLSTVNRILSLIDERRGPPR